MATFPVTVFLTVSSFSERKWFKNKQVHSSVCVNRLNLIYGKSIPPHLHAPQAYSTARRPSTTRRSDT